jgi:hypothetical protein
MTRAEVLRYAIAFALRRSRKIIRGLKEGLTEEERFTVADHAVAQLKERGDPWRLNDDAPTASEAAIDLIERKVTPPHPPPSVLSPGLPGRGSLFRFDITARDSTAIARM